MERLTRNRFLTPEEAREYQAVRDKIAGELPELLARRNMMAKDKEVILCLRVSDRGESYLVPGSMEAACVECGAMVYISPSLQDRVAQGSLPMCLICVQEAIEKTPPEEVKFGGIQPGQVQEFKEYLRSRNEGGPRS